MRLIDADAFIERIKKDPLFPLVERYGLSGVIENEPTIDAVPVIKCKDCKHRPAIDGEYENGFSIIFPDMICPCQCDDGWYNWMPEDDWYCGNAQEKQNESRMD